MIEDLWKHKNEIDCFVFPDCRDSGLQLELESQGRLVWGSKDSDSLETMRGQWLKACEALDLPMPTTHLIRGLTALQVFFDEHPGETFHVKISRFRGDMETWKTVEPSQIRAKLELLAMKFGPSKEYVTFYVQEPVETPIECYDKETEILTEYGWKDIGELRPEYEVATLNPKTREIEYHRPFEIVTGKSKTIFVCEKKKLNMGITSNHALIVSHHWNQTELQRMRLSDLSGMQYYMHAGGQWTGNEQEWFEVKKTPNGFNQTGRSRGNIRVKMDDWLEFLGWFISEGSITRSGYTIGICQSLSHPEERKKIESCLSRLPFKWNKNGDDYRIHSKQLYMHFVAQFRRGKRLPKYVKQLSPRQIRIVLDSIFLGDGSLCSNGVTKMYYNGPDKMLADDIQECIIKCGGSASVHPKAPLRDSKIGDRVIHRTKTTFHVSEHRSARFCFKRNDFKEVEYNDLVWCVNVTNHIVCVRRKGGAAVWSGNSGCDSYFVNGQWPSKVILGYEKKGESYFATWKERSEMPPAIWKPSEAMTELLASYNYCNFVSTEVRVKGDQSYLLDPCLRCPSPAGEEELELYGNFSEIVYRGAQGELVEPEMTAKFCGEAVISYCGDRDGWKSIVVPEEVRRWVKLYACAYEDGAYHFPPAQDPEAIGCIVGLADTPQGVLDRLKEIRDALKESDVDIHIEPIASLFDEIEEAEKTGIPFTEQKMPEPADVLDETP